MQVKTKYKPSELGLIPEDWQITSFGEICRVNQGLQIEISKRLKFPTPKSRKYITIQFLNDAKEVEYIDDYVGSVCCDQNDVLMTRTGNTGIVVTDVEGVFHNNFFKINFDRRQLDKRFLVNYLSFERTRKMVLVKAGTSTIPDLNHQDFYSIPLPLPPLSEQHAIATALSDVDALINSLDRLIAKKRDIKQATMQQLLAGKTRLPGFKKKDGFKQTEIGLIPEDWSAEPLGPHIKIASGESPSRFEAHFSGVPYFKVEQLNSGTKYIDQTPYLLNCEKRVGAGSILFPKRGASILLNKVRILRQDSWMDTNLMALSPNSSLSNEFLFYVLTFIELWRVADTTSIPQINNKHINPLILSLPSLPEQQAIAGVLSDMDAELSTLEKRRDKTLLLKQGMMQELLTGRTRLV